MFGRGVSTAAQIEYLDSEVIKVKTELAALHQRRELDRQDEVRAWAMLSAAQANQVRTEHQIEVRLEALVSLNREIADLIPKPREP